MSEYTVEGVPCTLAGRGCLVGITMLTRDDVSVFLRLIDSLADYEHLPRPDSSARTRLIRDAFDEPPPFRVLLANLSGQPVGYAVFFYTYSTFLARPTLYVEDVFVLPEARSAGIGRALMTVMAREAVRRGCGRMEWQALTWNKLATSFYEGLGARPLDDWQSFRLEGQCIARLAEK